MTFGSKRAAIEKGRADDRLANVAEQGAFAAPAGLGLAFPEPHRRADAPCFGNFGASLLAHQRGEAAGQLALGLVRKGVVKHVGDRDAEHPVAEKFETLV